MIAGLKKTEALELDFRAKKQKSSFAGYCRKAEKHFLVASSHPWPNSAASSGRKKKAGSSVTRGAGSTEAT